MLYALNGMRAGNRFQQRYSSSITARVYERYRIEHAANHSETMKGKTPPNKGRKMGEEQKQLLRERAKANHRSGVYGTESQQKRIAKVTGQKRTDETRKKMSLAHTGIIKGPQSDEHRKAISESSKGKKKTKDHSSNIRAAVLGNVSINKDGAEKKVKRDTLAQWLADGWSLGGRKRKQ
jgi:hypothetical protein